MAEIIDFTKIKTSDFADRSFECNCGKKHIVSAKKIYLGQNALSMLIPAANSVTPAGKVLLISSEQHQDIYLTKIERDLTLAGYSVIKKIFPNNFRPDIRLCGGLLGMPEDVRLAVCYGAREVTDTAKYYSSISKVKLIAVASSPSFAGYLSDVSMLYVDGIKEKLKSSAPYILLCDLLIMRKAPQNLIASGFGELCAGITALVDWNFSKCVTGEYLCDGIYRLSEQCLEMALNCGEGLINRSPEAIDILSDALVRSSICCNLLGDDRCNSGGESDFADALEMIKYGAKRQLLSYGETLMLGQKSVVNLYALYFAKKFSDTLMPPDKGLHASALSKVSGCGYFSALARMNYDLGVSAQNIISYKTEEFRRDFNAITNRAVKKAEFAQVIFKRIYPDAGYSVEGYISETEMRLAVALASDLKQRHTVLAQMRNNGLFEKYLSAFNS